MTRLDYTPPFPPAQERLFMTRLSRRQFIEDSLLAAAAMAALPGANLFAQDENESPSPNAKLGVAVAGVRSRGRVHLWNFLFSSDRRGGVDGFFENSESSPRRRDTEILYIVDPDEAIGQKRAEEIEKVQGRKPKFVQDIRKALDDKAVDILSAATPNHWHALAAIWAMQAGKHVYVEKPVSQTLSEGRRMVETARKYSRICQAGCQCRTLAGTVDAVQYVRSGKIGEVKLARGLCYKPRPSIGPPGQYKVPESVDYDLWSGPAPVLPLTRKEFHYDWHWQWPYGSGDLGNQGVHEVDIARWGLSENGLSQSIFSYGGRLGYQDAGETPNTQVLVHEFADGKTLVFEVRGLKTADLKGAKIGVVFYGSEGYVVLTSYTSGAAFDPEGNLVKRFTGGGNHFTNFLNAVRSGKWEDLNADILDGHLSSALCHMGNISYRLGEEMTVAEVKKRLADINSNENCIETFDRVTAHLTDNKVNIEETKLRLGPVLAFDPASETFTDNQAANTLITRDYRSPFVVPTAGEV
jgi:predicted dehydrogenase